MALKVCGATGSVPASAVAVDYLPYLHGAPTNNYIFDGDVKAALFYATGATANSTITPPGFFSLGMTDGTNHAELNVGGADGVSQTNWRTRLRSGAAAGFTNIATGTQLWSATAAIVQNGVRLNHSIGSATSYRCNALLIGGPGVEAQVVTGSLSGTLAVNVTHSLSHSPNLIYAIGASQTLGSFAGQGRSTYGWGIPGVNYVSCQQTRLDGQPAEDGSQRLDTTFLFAEINNAGTIVYSATAGNFTTGAFDVTPSANAGTDGFALLLLYVPNLGAKAGTFDLPTNTTEFPAVTGMTKRPKVIFFLPSILTAVGTASVSDNAGWFGFGAAWENNGYPEQFSGGVLTDDGASPTNNKSMTSGLMMQVPTLSGSPVTQLLAHLSAFNNDGVNVTMGTADTTVRKAGYLAFGDVAAGVVLAGANVDPLIDGSPVILTSTQSSFGASGNTVSWGGQSFSVTAQDVDQITSTAAIGINLYGEVNDLAVTAGSVSNALKLTMQPTTGQRYFDLSGGLNSAVTIRFEALPDLVSNAQIHVSALRDSTSASISTSLLEILADGTPSLARSVSLPAQIDARANNRDGQGWGAVETITVGLSYLTVVDERGLGEAAAVADLQSLGFSVRITRTSSLTVAQGLVISQLPLSGAQVPLGTEVELIVSLGAGNAPTGLTGFALSAGSVRLSWNAP